MYYMGLDIGSLSCDAVVIDARERIVGAAVVPTGARNREAIERVSRQVLRDCGLREADLAAVVSTGYGRERVERRLATVTEISCHGRGIQKLLPGTRLMIDIGGQDSKAILFDPAGNVADFAMNDKCAAGTGRFLEAMARALEVGVEDLCDLDLGASGSSTISSMCTVFAESEVVSLIAEGTEVGEIVSGLHRSIASRTVSLVRRVMPAPARLSGAGPGPGLVAMSGGVAYNSGVVRALEAVLGCPITVPDRPDTVGALGAALFARERSNRATP